MGRKDKSKALKVTVENTVSRLTEGIRDTKPTSYSHLGYSTKRLFHSVFFNHIADAEEIKEIVQLQKASGRPDPKSLHRIGWRADEWLLPQLLKATKKDIEKKRVSRAANKTETRQDFDKALITENLEE